MAGRGHRKPGQGQRVRRCLSAAVHSIAPALHPGKLYTPNSLGLAQHSRLLRWSWGVMLSCAFLSSFPPTSDLGSAKWGRFPRGTLPGYTQQRGRPRYSSSALKLHFSASKWVWERTSFEDRS